MPIYPYKCCECEHTFEEMQGINENKLEECPNCKKKSLTRIITIPTVIFIGVWNTPMNRPLVN